MSTLRCHTTILFADLSSSTHIGESLDPEQLAELLGQLRKLAEEVIDHYGGVVNQFYGDGVLAAFGFLDPREDDVVHAINAALELHDRAASILPIPGIDSSGFTIQLHSGIHAGLVFVQDGDYIQGRYKLTGDALNTAARLSDAAAPGEILVSEPTIRCIMPYFETESVPPLKLKGKRAALEACKVICRTNVRTRFEASVRRGLSDFIGRLDEIDRMFADFARVENDGLLFLELCGDPGVGKTRLSEEFLSRTSGDTTVCKAYCESGSSGRPFQPFIQIIHALLDLKPSTPQKEATILLQRAIQEHYPSLTEYESDLLTLLGLADAPQQRQDGAQLAQRSIAAIIALIENRVEKDRLILYLDDWHLADDLSSKTLYSLMEQLSQRPIYIIAASRTASEELKRFHGRSVQLEPLSQQESTRLAAGFFSNNAIDQFANMLFEQSGGNPLFIEELCQSITGSPEAHPLHDRVPDVPVTLSGLIASRMSRLPDSLAQLVKVAAVLGTTFDKWLYRSMTDAQITDQQLHELAEYDVIYPGGTQGTLRFKHGITREVAYETTRLQERKALHVKATTILEEQLNEQGSGDYYEMLAYHFEGAGDRPGTARYAELAGDRALSTMALDRAGEQFMRALTALDPDNSPDNSYERWKAVLLKFGLVTVFDPSQEYLEVFHRGLALAETHQDLEGQAKTRHWLGYLYYSLGDSTPAIEHCEQALVTAAQLNASALQVETLALLGQAKGSAALYDEAIKLHDQAMNAKNQHRKRNRISVGSAFSLACKASALGDQGNFDLAYECFEDALASLQGMDHQLEGSIRGLYSEVCLWQGRWQQGKDNADRAHQIAQKISSAYMSKMYLSLSTYADWIMNGNEACIGAMLSTTHLLEQRNKMLFISLNYGWAADMLVTVNKWQSARKYAARAIVRARHHDRIGEAMAYRALSRIAEHHQPGNYQHYLERAMASADARGSRHERAKNHFHWAMALQREQQYHQAQRHLELAINGFQEMDMNWFADKAMKFSRTYMATG